ncbi:hypothetical protein R0131_15305 [Clostridium sp. AL.422]|nr:hypothetical protein [Clostridium sp. AL.422]
MKGIISKIAKFNSFFYFMFWGFFFSAGYLFCKKNNSFQSEFLI